MVTPYEAKYQIEQVHMAYLQKLGFLSSDIILNGLPGAKPDLINPGKTHFFELKSRNYPYFIILRSFPHFSECYTIFETTLCVAFVPF